jgi:protein-tyrosine phosphatase
VRILFVCMGNICRSPTAEGVFRALVEEEGRTADVETDSAGTGGWHVGSAPDERATEAAARRGITLEGSARQVQLDDFRDFDLLVAMDAENVADLQRVAPDAEAAGKIRLLREYDPEAATEGDLDVPDPYYGGDDGFERVLDMVQRASRGLLDEVAPSR